MAAQQTLTLLDMVRFHAGLPFYEVNMKNMKNMAISFAIEEMVNKNTIKKPLPDNYDTHWEFFDRNHPGFEAKDEDIPEPWESMKHFQD